METRIGLGVLGFSVAFGAALGGTWIGSFLGSGTSRAGPPVSRAASPASTIALPLPELRELAGEVRALTQLLAAREADGSLAGERTPVPAAVPSLGAALAREQELERRMAEAESRLDALPGTLDIPPKGAMRTPPPDADDSDQRRLTRQHLFWSPQTVLSTYGRPDGVRVKGDVEEWIYAGRPRGLCFRFHAGRCFQIWAE